MGGTDHLFPACDMRTSLWSQRASNVPKTARHGALSGSFFLQPLISVVEMIYFCGGGLSKLQLRTKKAAYQVVETAQGIIYI